MRFLVLFQVDKVTLALGAAYVKAYTPDIQDPYLNPYLNQYTDPYPNPNYTNPYLKQNSVEPVITYILI